MVSVLNVTGRTAKGGCGIGLGLALIPVRLVAALRLELMASLALEVRQTAHKLILKS